MHGNTKVKFKRQNKVVFCHTSNWMQASELSLEFAVKGKGKA